MVQKTTYFKQHDLIEQVLQHSTDIIQCLLKVVQLSILRHLPPTYLAMIRRDRRQIFERIITSRRYKTHDEPSFRILFS